MAATRRQHKNQKESAWVPPLQRDPGPWNRLLLNWLATLAIIMVFGLVMLYSASYTTGYLRMGDSLHYIKQQAICMAIGIGCMVVMSYVDHRFLRWASKPLYWVVLAMLAVTLTFAPLNGCRRWIRLGGLTLQTSEVAKFEMILLSSHLAASAPQIGRFSPSLREKIKPKDWLFIRIVRQLIVPVLPLVPVVVLLFLEPHMSGILLTTAIVGTILMLTGCGGVLTWCGAAAAALLLKPALTLVESIGYLQDRLNTWSDDLEALNDQTKQSLYAIGSGGLKGLGLGNSVEKQLWLPESTNDFIFSVVCEELGFIGAVLIIVLFILLIAQGLMIAIRPRTSSAPWWGLALWRRSPGRCSATSRGHQHHPEYRHQLPFFSSGGTSLILLLAEMGVMVNIGRNGERAAQQRAAAHAQRQAAKAQRDAELKDRTINLDDARRARNEL